MQQKLQALLSKSYGHMKNRSDFIFRQCTPKDADKINKMVLWFLTTSFVTESMKLKPEDAKDVAKYYLDSYLFNGLSFGVFEKPNDKLAGIGFIAIENYGSKVNMEKVPESYRRQVRLQIAAEGGFMTGKSPALGKYGRIRFCSVYPQYARSGMASEMNEVVHDIFKLHGCRAIAGSASSAHILKICLRSGFEVTGRIKLAEYVDSVTGEKPFVDANPPHDYYHWVNKPLHPTQNKL